MKIVLPENQDDIQLSTYQKFMQLDKEADNYLDSVFCLFTGVDIENIKNVSKKDVDDILKQVFEALNSEGTFKQRFKIDGIEFGLIPNFDKITGGEYSDLVKYSSKEKNGYNEYLDRLIAVLYRPIHKSDSFKNYTIESYNGTSGHIHLINKLPISIVNGVLGFFLTLYEDLENHIEKCILVEQVKELAH